MGPDTVGRRRLHLKGATGREVANFFIGTEGAAIFMVSGSFHRPAQSNALLFADGYQLRKSDDHFKKLYIFSSRQAGKTFRSDRYEARWDELQEFYAYLEQIVTSQGAPQAVQAVKVASSPVPAGPKSYRIPSRCYVCNGVSQLTHEIKVTRHLKTEHYGNTSTSTYRSVALKVEICSRCKTVWERCGQRWILLVPTAALAVLAGLGLRMTNFSFANQGDAAIGLWVAGGLIGMILGYLALDRLFWRIWLQWIHTDHPLSAADWIRYSADPAGLYEGIPQWANPDYDQAFRALNSTGPIPPVTSPRPTAAPPAPKTVAPNPMVPIEPPAPAPPPQVADPDPLTAKLRKLQLIQAEGLITQAEYERKKQELLDSL